MKRSPCSKKIWDTKSIFTNGSPIRENDFCISTVIQMHSLSLSITSLQFSSETPSKPLYLWASFVHVIVRQTKLASCKPLSTLSLKLNIKKRYSSTLVFELYKLSVPRKRTCFSYPCTTQFSDKVKSKLLCCIAQIAFVPKSCRRLSAPLLYYA